MGETIVVGVLNVTPDSFADGGVNFDPDRAVEAALALEAETAKGTPRPITGQAR